MTQEARTQKGLSLLRIIARHREHFVESVGKLVQGVATIEHSMVPLFGLLFGLDYDRAAVILSRVQGPNAKAVMILQALHSEWVKGVDVQTLKPLLDEALKIIETRNQLSHNLLTPDFDSILQQFEGVELFEISEEEVSRIVSERTIISRFSVKSREFESKTFSRDEIIKLARRANQIAAELHSAVKASAGDRYAQLIMPLSELRKLERRD